MDQREPMTEVSLTPAELEMVRNALKLLEATLGHEEADELVAVQQVLAKLDPRKH